MGRQEAGRAEVVHDRPVGTVEDRHCRGMQRNELGEYSVVERRAPGQVELRHGHAMKRNGLADGRVMQRGPPGPVEERQLRVVEIERCAGRRVVVHRVEAAVEAGNLNQMGRRRRHVDPDQAAVLIVGRARVAVLAGVLAEQIVDEIRCDLARLRHAGGPFRGADRRCGLRTHDAVGGAGIETGLPQTGLYCADAIAAL